MATSSQPYSVVIGRVVGSFQGTNSYDVITSSGRFIGGYHGDSRGNGGVTITGSIMPGSFVWVAFHADEKFCLIIGVALPNWPVSASDPTSFATYPQVAGFELGKRAIGQIVDQQLLNVPNRSSDVLHDLVDGEWAAASTVSGAAVAVEHYRAWLRAGAMAGIWCWADEQRTRLAGLDFEFLTLAQNDYDRRLGNAIVQQRGRVFYPSEALSGDLPRELEVAGAIHGGRQRFLAPQGRPGTPRPALFHEYLGTDGRYALTSASGIVLQRYAGVRVPEEAQAPAVDPTDPLVDGQPLDDQAVREAALADPRPPLSAAATEKNGLSWVQHTLDLVESLVTVRGRGGFDRLPVQWPGGDAPLDQVPEDLLHSSYGANMWRALPQSFPLRIDDREKTKQFYAGRSAISLLPDGSVVIEDAWHSQIVMSGGNIVLSAAHDIVLAPGRNLIGLAGRDASLKASRHIDVAANEGRLSLKAEDQLSILGGNGGLNGVLIESRGDSAIKAGTGTDQRLGGVLIKSQTGTYLQGSEIGLTATTASITAQAADRVDLIGQTVSARSPNGFVIYFDPAGTEPSYAFTDSAAVFPAGLVVANEFLCLGDGFFDGNVIINESLAAGGQVTGSSVAPSGDDGARQVAAAAKTARAAAQTVSNTVATFVSAIVKSVSVLLTGRNPLNKSFWTNLGFSFATSKQLNYSAGLTWLLPELSWQTMARRGDHGAGKVWTERPVASPAGDNLSTAPVPGYEAWTGPSYQLNDQDLYVDLSDGQSIPFDGTSILPPVTAVTLDGNYLIGSDQ